MTTITLADYLFTRLRQLGVQSIHGVPGDYNLTLLDHIAPAGIHWVGNCNELNAGYAADGYARIKGIGALITTFGVGELSAINALAGAYAELVPVVHIVGTPARPQQESRALIHHTLLDGNFEHFSDMYKHVTVAQADLKDAGTAPKQIDETLRRCIESSRPVYIRVPVDMVSVSVSASNLTRDLLNQPHLSPESIATALDSLCKAIQEARASAILVDCETRAYNIVEEVDELVRLTSWPTWVTSGAKDSVNEDLDNFHGIWKGRFAPDTHKEYMSSSDLVLCFGPHFSGTNSYAYTAVPEDGKTVFIHAEAISVKGTKISGLSAKPLMRALIDRLKAQDTGILPSLDRMLMAPLRAQHTTSDTSLTPDGRFTQADFYNKLNPWLRPGDIILGETGTAGHGCRDFRLPPGARLFKPVTWLSIGYMLPAAQGAALAQRELHRAGKWVEVKHESSQPRTVLLIGDGSFQMTVQELSTIIREELNVLIVLINNDGYTIERCIHGEKETYNDVARWKYLEAASFFGAKASASDGSYHAQTCRVETWGELGCVFDAMQENDPPKLQMVEVVMEREDAPEVLADMLQTQRARLAS